MANTTQTHTVKVPENLPGGIEGNPSAPSVMQVPREITPEIVAVIQAAASEFVGKRVRIVSIRILPASNTDSGVWLRRGRDTVQASHNLVQQRH